MHLKWIKENTDNRNDDEAKAVNCLKNAGLMMPNKPNTIAKKIIRYKQNQYQIFLISQMAVS